MTAIQKICRHSCQFVESFSKLQIPVQKRICSLVILLGVTCVFLFYRSPGLSVVIDSTADRCCFSLSSNGTAVVQVNSVVDDYSYKDPTSYDAGTVHQHYILSVTIKNVGNSPLMNTKLIANNRDFSTFAGLREYLNLKGEDNGEDIRILYDFWIRNRFHSTSDTWENQNPFAILNYFGYSLCTDDTCALTGLATYMGIRSRRFHLQGHALAEYFFDGRWNILDGDTNVTYWNWDNRTNASYRDLCRDPFLATRVKVYGRNQAHDFAKSWQATSVFNLAKPSKTVEVSLGSHAIPDLSNNGWNLYPEEYVVYHNDHPSPVAIGKRGAVTDERRESALALVEWKVNGSQRLEEVNHKGTIRLQAPYPIYRLVDQNDNSIMEIDTSRPTLSLELPANKCSSVMTVYCQAARLSLPILQKGKNIVRLESKTRSGRASITYSIKPPGQRLKLPIVKINSESSRFDTSTPVFGLSGDENTDRLWWQISETPSFRFLIPNFDSVISPTETIRLTKIDSTFFIPERLYYIRVKGRRNGVWGEWCSPFSFQIPKPHRPESLSYRTNNLNSGDLTLQWDSCGADVEYLVFGSDRLDFVPDVYTATEICEMRKDHFKILKSRPNKNFIGSTLNNEFVVSRSFFYYRVIAKRDEIYSTPSDLLHIRGEDVESFGRRTPKVFQTRWAKEINHEAALGYEDVYHAREVPVEIMAN